MAKLSILAGATSVTINVFIASTASTTGAGLTGLVFNTSGLTAYYVLPAAASAAITLATLAAATSAWSSGGFKEIDSTNCPGWYRFDIPNAAIASGRFVSVHFQGAANMAPLPFEIELTAWNNQDAVHGGMSALPNTACTTNASLLTSGTGTDQLSVASGRIDIGKALGTAVTLDSNNVLNVSTKYLAGTALTGRDIGASVLLSTGTGTGQLDFTSGVVKANATQWLGGTIPAVNVTGVPLVDVKYLLGTIWSTPTVAGIPNVNVKTWNDLATVALPLIPTTAGRTLDVSATGEAGVDWANVGSPTTALALTGTTIASTQKVDVETIKTNPVVNAGTVTFPTTATLASTANITAATGVDITKILGTAISTPATAGILDVNVKNMNNVAATSVTAVNANQGTTQPVNFTGTGASALAKGDTIDWASQAIPGTNVTGIPLVDVAKWQGSAPAFLDSSGKVQAVFYIRQSTAQAGGASSITLNAGESVPDQIFKGEWILIVSGTGFGQTRLITNYTDATKIALVAPAWATVPDSSSIYSILPAGGVDVELWSQNPVTFSSNPDVNTKTIAAGSPVVVDANGLMKVDTEDWKGGAVPSVNVSGVPKVDLVDWLGTAPLALSSQQVQAVVPASTVVASVTAPVSIAAGQLQIIKNAAYANFEFLMVDSSGNPATGLTVTATRSIDGAAFGSCANSVTEVSSGIYKISLAAADLNGKDITLLFTATGAKNSYIKLTTQV